MKASIFRIGTALIIVGIIWISLVFAEGQKTDAELHVIKHAGSAEISMEFSETEDDIGFYRIHMPEFVAGNEIFVQIRDSNNNVIQEQMIHTRMTVGYFDFDHNGMHTAIMTNISEYPILVEAEMGNTNSHQMMPAGILILVGVISIMIITYIRLYYYNTAQPEENIS